MSCAAFEKHQYSAKEAIRPGASAFRDNGDTSVYWLGGAGVLLNSHGSAVLVDPVLTVVDEKPCRSEVGALPLLTLPPLKMDEIPDGCSVLYTHADEDHMGPLTLLALNQKGARFYGTPFTCNQLSGQGVPQERLHALGIGERFLFGGMTAFTTPCRHSWQIDRPGYDWHYGNEDCCGFCIETSDGVVWLPGDSRLMEEHLNIPNVDLLFFDVGDDPWHFGCKGAVKLFNAYPKADKILYHCGTFYSPDEACHNGDPAKVLDALEHPETLHILAPGEKFILKRL